MSKLNEKIYAISSIDLLINGQNETDMGDYILQYFTMFDNISYGLTEVEDEDACLAIAVRLKNKKNDKTVYGETFYKKLIRHESCYKPEIREKLNKMMEEFSNKTNEEKISFIFRPESKIFKRPFAKSDTCPGKISSFLQDLERVNETGAYIGIGRFPKEAMPYLDEAYNNVIEQIGREHKESRRK